MCARRALDYGKQDRHTHTHAHTEMYKVAHPDTSAPLKVPYFLFYHVHMHSSAHGWSMCKNKRAHKHTQRCLQTLTHAHTHPDTHVHTRAHGERIIYVHKCRRTRGGRARARTLGLLYFIQPYAFIIIIHGAAQRDNIFRERNECTMCARHRCQVFVCVRFNWRTHSRTRAHRYVCVCECVCVGECK